MKKKIQLEVKLFGAVLAWEVFLENTNSSSRVKGFYYDNSKDAYVRIIDEFPITDGTLDVYLGCEGVVGGFTECSVVIDNNMQAQKVKCFNVDPNYAHQSFNLNHV